MHAERAYFLWFKKSVNIAILLVIGSSIIRFIGIGEKQLWLDEIIQVLHSQPESISEILRSVSADRGGAPLDYIIQHYVMNAFGKPDEVSARLHSAFFGSISIALIYILGLKLFRSQRIALLSAALLGVYPFHHHYSQEARPYALFFMLTLILFIQYFLTRAQFSWLKVLLMTLTAVLSFYTHPYTALVFCIFFAISIINSLKKQHRLKIKSEFAASVIACTIGACAYLPWLIYSIHKTLGDSTHPLHWGLIPQMIKGLGDGSYPVSLLLLSLAVLGVVQLRRNKNPVLIDLSCWVIVPMPLILAILYWRSYFFTERQLLFLTPAIIFLAACGIDYLISTYGKRMAIVPAAYACLCLVVIGLHYEDKRIDFRGVGNYLRHTVNANDRIFAPDTLGILSYYFPTIWNYEAKNLDSESLPHGKDLLYIIDTQYTTEAERQASLNAEKEMELKNRLIYRGAVVSILSREMTK